MDILKSNLLTVLIFLPTAGALATLIAPRRELVRRVALATTVLTFLLSLLLLITYDWNKGIGYAYEQDGGTVQMVTAVKWIPTFNIEYRIGLDGLSLPLVLLTTFICALSCIASWNIQKMTKGYMALFLFLETGLLGTFLALDLFLFYVFFEVTLLPMYFLIGVWGGPRKEYAAIKFFLYTLVGAIALLVAIIGTYLYSGRIIPGGTFDLVRLASPAFQQSLIAILPVKLSQLFFGLLMLGFLIKVPSVPFHTWLPDAHVEAPTPVSMILAALLLKMGGYGIFRIAYPLFPQAAKELWLVVAIIGVVSILYGALCALGQTDFKRLVAYSSVSHMGYVVLGAAMMTPAAVNGALFMMVAHGIVSAFMFFIVGVIYDRAHHRDLARLGGIATTMPIYTGFGAVACFANLGLPGLCVFVGEVMVLLGSFAAARNDSVLMSGDAGRYGSILTLAVISCFGIVLTAGYMLWAIQRVFLGPENPAHKNFPEASAREIGVMTPLTIMAIALGVLPGFLFFSLTNASVSALFKLFG